MASDISLTRWERRLQSLRWLLRWSAISSLWAGSLVSSVMRFYFRIQLMFGGQCSCMQINLLLLKSPLFCFFSGGHCRERDRGNTSGCQGSSWATRSWLDLCGSGGGGGGDGGSISLHFLFDEDATLCGGLGTNKTITGSQMWKICHVTGANTEKYAHTLRPCNSLL